MGDCASVCLNVNVLLAFLSFLQIPFRAEYLGQRLIFFFIVNAEERDLRRIDWHEMEKKINLYTFS